MSGEGLLAEKYWPAASAETELDSGSWSGSTGSHIKEGGWTEQYCPNIFSAAHNFQEAWGVSKSQHREKRAALTSLTNMRLPSPLWAREICGKKGTELHLPDISELS